MAIRRIELHPAAIEEAREARLWYAARSPAAAARFMVEFDRAINCAPLPHRICPRRLREFVRAALEMRDFSSCETEATCLYYHPSVRTGFANLMRLDRPYRAGATARQLTRGGR